MKTSNLYRGFRYLAEIISHVVWLYFRFSLSLRDIEELMASRGIVVTDSQFSSSGPQNRTSVVRIFRRAVLVKIWKGENVDLYIIPVSDKCLRISHHRPSK
jgi:transposase-like protein